MNKIIIYYGPKEEFKKILPKEYKNFLKLVLKNDRKSNIMLHVVPNDDIELAQKKLDEPEQIENLVAFSELYSGLNESAIQSFISILRNDEISNLYLQNPPKQIVNQLEQEYQEIIDIKKFKYPKLTDKKFRRIEAEFNDNILGQDNAKEKILNALYPLLNAKEKKPVVIMLYGVSGVGKTETAKFISKVFGKELFRKQFSMFNNIEFSNYVFGGKHSEDSLAKNFLDRNSNVILIDEFDKPASIFHSAFYQLFDEGIFEDKNYKVEMHNSIIICTSNYTTIEEIRRKLGDPIFYRFNNFIEYKEFSDENKKIIIRKIVNSKYNDLNKKDKLKINKEEIINNISKFIPKLKNFRNIEILIQEMIGQELVKKYFEKK